MQAKKFFCEECKKERPKNELIQHFDVLEPTTIHLFCSEKCKNKWMSMHDLKKLKK